MQHQRAWYKLFAGFKYIFESASSSGNETIQLHIEKVLDRLDDSLNQPIFQKKEPLEKPVCSFLTQTLQEGSNNEENPLLRSIGELRTSIAWQYGYTEMPKNLKEKYAYTEIIGPHGNLYAENLVIGLVLLGKDCHYPKHKHSSIEESYICLSGEVSINDDGVFKPDSLIYNPPGKAHELRTGNQPCLLAFSWIADSQTLNEFSMTFE